MRREPDPVTTATQAWVTAQIAAHVAKYHAASPPPPPPPPSGVIRSLSPGATTSQLLAALGDNTVDAIEFGAGSYNFGASLTIGVDRTRPVIVRPAPSSVATLRTALIFGAGSPAGNIALDGLALDSIVLGQYGAITYGNCHDISVRRCTFRNITGQGAYSWIAYASSANGAGARNCAFDDNDAAGSKVIGGIQFNHDPNARGFSVRRNKLSGFLFSVYAAADATGLAIEDNQFTNCGSSHDNGQYSFVAVGVAGTYKGNHSTGSAPPYIYAPALVDGGGNTWA